MTLGTTVHPASAHRFSDELLPVSSPVTGALVFFPIHKGFKADWLKSIAFLPVISNAFDGQRQHFTGEILDSDPWENKKAGIIDDEMQSLATIGFTPIDPSRSANAYAEATSRQPKQRRYSESICDTIKYR